MLAPVSAELGVGIVPSGTAKILPPNVITSPLKLEGHQTALGLAWTDLDTPIKRTLHSLMQEVYP
jgi:hypothetical protein